MMAQYVQANFTGVVVRKRNYRERDLLVEMLTDRFGFKTFLVRGATKRGFKLGAAVLPFAHGQYSGGINQAGLSYLSTVGEVTLYDHIVAGIQVNAYATYMLALVKAAFDRQPLGAYFNQVQTALKLMNAQQNPKILTNIIEVQLLSQFGVAQHWESCCVCGETTGSFDYSQSYGGVLCARHYHCDPYRYHLSQVTVYYLRLFAQLRLQPELTIKVKESTEAGLRQALDRIYDAEVGVRVPAKHFIDQLGQWQQFLLQQQDKLKKSPKKD